MISLIIFSSLSALCFSFLSLFLYAVNPSIYAMQSIDCKDCFIIWNWFTYIIQYPLKSLRDKFEFHDFKIIYSKLLLFFFFKKKHLKTKWRCLKTKVTKNKNKQEIKTIITNLEEHKMCLDNWFWIEKN